MIVCKLMSLWCCLLPNRIATKQNSGGAGLPAAIAEGDVEISWMDEATQSWLVRSVKPNVRAREVLAHNNVELLRHFRHKSRRWINEQRQRQQHV